MARSKLNPAQVNNPYKFSLTRAASFSTSGGSSVVMQYDTKIFDTSSNTDVVTNKGRFTAPVAGIYQFNANIAIGGTTTATGLILLYKNGLAGTLVSRGTDLRMSSSNKCLVLSTMVQLVAGDYVEVAVFTDVTAALDVTAIGNNTFSGFLVSST